MKKEKVPINIMVDKEVKENATKVLDDLGLSMSAAITLYLKQVYKKKGIPFNLRTK